MHIFQIGFSKAGTTSLHKLFLEAGLTSIHWHKGKLAKSIHAAILAGDDPLRDYPDVQCFTEMSVVTPEVYIDNNRQYEVLEARYPDALFILNTRNVDDWVASRNGHRNIHDFKEGQQTMAERYASALGLTQTEVEEFWRADWLAHHVRVRAHFRDNPRFIEWNIDYPASGEALIAFLRGHLPDVPFGSIERHNVSARP